MIRRILLPLDGSVQAETSVGVVRALTRAFHDARVLALQVLEGGDDHDLGSVDWRLRRAEAASYLEGVARDLREDGLDVRTRVTQGPAAEEILAAAAGWEADLIVLSPHGKGESVGFRTGGTASKVVSAAPTSILLSRPAEPPAPSGEGREMERIVVPVDGSSRGDWALCLASSLARSNDAELVVLTVLPPPDLLEPGPIRSSEDELLERLALRNRAAAERHLRRVCDQLATPDLHIRSRIESGTSVPRTLDRICLEEGASLAVLAAHGRTGAGGWPYGSVSRAYLDHGSVSTLVLQDDRRRLVRRSPFSRQDRAADPPRQAWTA